MKKIAKWFKSLFTKQSIKCNDSNSITSILKPYRQFKYYPKLHRPKR